MSYNLLNSIVPILFQFLHLAASCDCRYLKCIRGGTNVSTFMSYNSPPGYVSYQQEYEVPEEEDDTCELELPSPLELSAQVNVLICN